MNAYTDGTVSQTELPGLLCRMAGRFSEADPEGRTCGQRLMEKGSLEKSVMWGGSGGGWGTGLGRKKPSRGVISGEDSAPPRALTQETPGINLAEFVPPQGKGLGFQAPAPIVARHSLLGKRKLGLSGHPPVLRRKSGRAEKLGGAQRTTQRSWLTIAATHQEEKQSLSDSLSSVFGTETIYSP